MIVWSKQHKIISDTALSFKKLERVHTKVSGSILNRDMMFLKESKNITKTEADFKFLVLWTVFANNSSKIDTMKLLQSYDKDAIKEINKDKELVVLYKNTFMKDQEAVEGLILTPKNVLGLYTKKKISLLFVYWFFEHQDFDLSRIQKRTTQRIQFFMKYFPVVQDYLDSL